MYVGKFSTHLEFFLKYYWSKAKTVIPKKNFIKPRNNDPESVLKQCHGTSNSKNDFDEQEYFLENKCHITVNSIMEKIYPGS